MRILMTGAGGLLGGRLATLLGRRLEVVAARHMSRPPEGLPQAPLNLLSAISLETTIDWVRPDAVVHSAAFADADACEKNPERAEALNVRASRILARLCKDRGIRMVAISTDLVFGGDRPFAKEADAAKPIMEYGRTKLLGEEAALEGQAVVVRVSLVHGLA